MQAGTKEGSLVLCEEYTGVEEMTTRQILAGIQTYSGTKDIEQDFISVERSSVHKHALMMGIWGHTPPGKF